MPAQFGKGILDYMKKSIIRISFIVLLFLITTSCNKISPKDSKAPEPSIDIIDMSKDSKMESNNMFVFENNYTYLKQIFWNESQKEEFYKGQIKVNDVNFNEVLKNKSLEAGPLFKDYKIQATFTSKTIKPSLILGKVEDEQGHTQNWKQSYVWEDSEEDGLIHLPTFEGKSAKVSLRFIWLNKDQKCYGIVDKFIILNKQ